MERRDLAEFYGPNAGYVSELLERLAREPDSLGSELRAALERLPAQAAAGPELEPLAPSDGQPLPPAAGLAALANDLRRLGHLAARLDPLGSPPPGDPQLELEAHALDGVDLRALPARAARGPIARRAANGAEALALLRQVYCGTTGYELGQVESPEERAWLLEAIETERFRPPAEPIDERALLERLSEVSAFERFLHRAYPGQTRFSVEGLGMLIPMLDELLCRAAEGGVRTVLLGMAHRGRLNVLAHVLGKPYEQILAEFEGLVPRRRTAQSESTDEGWSGDVKYHAGGRRALATDGQGGTVAVVLAPNPSHLELVNPVVEGMARAAARSAEPAVALAVLIHGDAAFPGQGVVAETLSLSRLPGYRTGGTIHLIANNQLGFTTAPAEGRSTLYASDLAKGFAIPVVHVNADDPLACLAAVRLAVAYRARYGKDFLIDLIGYRRWGHNEGDEPAFTQPLLYERIRQHPTVRELFAADLARRGAVAEDEPAALLQAGLEEFQRLRESVTAAAGERQGQPTAEPAPPAPAAPEPVAEPVGLEALAELNAALLTFPDGFALHPRLERPIGRRRAAFEQPDGTVDWGHAETLAFATILREGTPIRLTGQDTIRGTFSQRHLTFYDARSGQPFTPLAALPGAWAAFEAHNSPLSEVAALGFEYGYSVQAPDTLVIWEAQYGDFINMAQAIVDEFVVSGQAKWGLTSGLVLLLPHAWEGQGPDHSGGRLERFLQLAAEDNLRIANCTTAAQYFLLLRRQAAALANQPRPLVVMTPKSLLRHPLAASPVRDLAAPFFRPVLDDPAAANRPERIRRLALCSGKVWADLEGHPRRAAAADLAIVRLEELYPFPAEELAAVLDGYPWAREVVWLQEEPRNAGAWSYVEPRLRALLGAERALRYVGRPERASPAEGWAEAHAAEQQRLLEAALGEVESHAG